MVLCPILTGPVSMLDVEGMDASFHTTMKLSFSSALVLHIGVSSKKKCMYTAVVLVLLPKFPRLLGPKSEDFFASLQQ